MGGRRRSAALASEQLTKLTMINANYCRMRTPGALAMGTGLPGATALSMMGLHANEVGPAGVKALDPFFGRCAFPGLDINGDGGGHRLDRDGPPDCVMQ